MWPQNNTSNNQNRVNNRFLQVDLILSFLDLPARENRQESEGRRQLVRGRKLSYPQSVASRTVRVLWKAVARLPNDSVKLPEILKRRRSKIRPLGMDFFVDGTEPREGQFHFPANDYSAAENSFEVNASHKIYCRWNKQFLGNVNDEVFTKCFLLNREKNQWVLLF